MNKLIDLVKIWAHKKGILENGWPRAQSEKTIEEVNELIEAVGFQSIGIEEFTNSKGKVVNTQEEIKDAIGDIMVTLIIQCEMQDLKLKDCLESAYDVISKRTGRMISGQFVKDE